MSINKTQPIIFFDFDGTLADTQPWVLSILNQFLHKHSLPDIKRVGEFHSRVTQNLKTFKFELYGLRSRLKKEVLDHLGNKIKEVPLQKNMQHLIPQLAKRGYKLGILTTNRLTTVNHFLKQNQLDAYFSTVISSENKRQALARIIKQNKYDLKKMIYVGDQASDIEETHGLAHTIGVTWGYETGKEIHTARPTYIINRTKALPGVITHILKDPNMGAHLETDFANYLIAADVSEKQLSKVFFEKFNEPYHSNNIFELIYCHGDDNHLSHDEDELWVKAAMLIAMNDLFDHNGNIHHALKSVLFDAATEVNAEDKQKLLLSYVQNFILKEFPSHRTFKLQQFSKLLSNEVNHLTFDFEGLTKFQMESLDQLRLSKNASIHKVMLEELYKRQHYYFKKTIENPDLDKNVRSCANAVLDEIESLKSQKTIAPAQLTKALISVNQMMKSPTDTECKKCYDTIQGISKKPIINALVTAVKLLISSLLKLPFNLFMQPKMPARGVGFFEQVSHEPLKFKVDQLIEATPKFVA